MSKHVEKQKRGDKNLYVLNAEYEQICGLHKSITLYKCNRQKTGKHLFKTRCKWGSKVSMPISLHEVTEEQNGELRVP